MNHPASFFLDFRSYGFPILLTLPLLLYLLWTLPKRTRGERALLLVFLLTYVFFILSGQSFGRRYSTLFPFLLTALLLLGWEFLKGRKSGVRAAAFMILGAACAANVAYFSGDFGAFLRERISREREASLKALLDFMATEPAGKEGGSAVLSASLNQIFFYYVGRPGIDSRDPRSGAVFAAKSKEEALAVLRDWLNVGYILRSWNFEGGPIFDRLLSENCELAWQDPLNGFYFYGIRDRDRTKAELDALFPNDSLLRNGSFESWSGGPSAPPDGFEKGDGITSGMVSREEADVQTGRCAVRIKGDRFNFAQELAEPERLRGKTITGFVWMKTAVPGKYRMEITDGRGASFSARHSGSGRWELLQVNHSVDPRAPAVTVRVVQAERTGGDGDSVLVDGALALERDWNTFYIYAREMDKKKAGAR